VCETRRRDRGIKFGNVLPRLIEAVLPPARDHADADDAFHHAVVVADDLFQEQSHEGGLWIDPSAKIRVFWTRETILKLWFI
jgi:hypothetical protein